MSKTQTLHEIQMEPSDIPGAPSGQKKGKKKPVENKEPEQNHSTSEKQLSYIEVTAKNRVKLHFAYLITEPIENTDDVENEMNDIIQKIDSRIPPPQSLINSMKKLRKIALDICEMPIPESHEISDYTVSAVKIAGDMVLRKSRAVLTIAKTVKRTGKIVHIVTPQVAMYSNSDYPKHEEMSKLIEEVVNEAWVYYEIIESRRKTQLPLFER